MTRRPPRTDGDLRLELLTRYDVEGKQQVLGRNVVVLHALRLVERSVEHARELGGNLGLLLRAVDARLLREPRLCLCAQ